MFWFIVFLMVLINIVTIPFSDSEIKRKKNKLIDDEYHKRFGKD